MLASTVRQAARTFTPEWEPHKETIYHLYITEDRSLLGSDGVIELMGSKYGFTKTEAQFEEHLRSWDFKKTQKKRIWKPISKVKKEKLESDKASEVYDGELISKAKLREQVRRYRKSPSGESSSDYQAPTPINDNVLVPSPFQSPHISSSELALNDSIVSLDSNTSDIEDHQQTYNTILQPLNKSTSDFAQIPPLSPYISDSEPSFINDFEPLDVDASDTEVSQRAYDMDPRLWVYKDRNAMKPPKVSTGPDPIEDYTSMPRSNRNWTLWSLLRDAGQRLFRRKLRHGYQRLEWRCTCGELLYGDFKENSLGSIERLAAKLTALAGQTPQSQGSSSMQSPMKAHLRKDSSAVGWSLHHSSQQVDSNGPSNQVAPAAARLRVAPKPHREALQLCIRTGKYKIELSELDSIQKFSDGHVFEEIRKQYELVRPSMLPIWMRFSKPEKAIFWKFRVGDRPLVSRIAGSVDAPEFPPASEVKSGNYKYDPCPMDDPPMDSNTFLHFFYGGTSGHPVPFWSQRLPWKLGPRIPPMVPGWGVYLEEEPNLPLFAAIMSLILLCSGLVAIAVALKTGDRQTAVAVGTWLTGVQTMGMGAFFFWWR